MEQAWSSHAARLRARLEEIKTPVQDWTTEELEMYLRDYKRRKRSTIRTRLCQLRFMENYAPMPVKLHGTRYELVQSFFLYSRVREEEEKAPATTLINDHKAIRSLGDFLGIPREIWPTAPTEPKNDERELPSPEDIYDLLHADYTPRPNVSYENALVKALLLLDFAVGVRFPSEAHSLRLRDFDPERHILTITEPKKSGRRRTVLIEPEWICCSARQASLANYLAWRKKVDPEGREDAFFLKPNGRPFHSKFGLSKFLNDHVKPRFPWFHPYLGRHWCANARLIDQGFDYARVADWLGHERLDMTRREYEHGARIYERLYGRHWLDRIARRTKSAQKTPMSFRPQVERVNAPAGIRTQVGSSKGFYP